jgi:hypothetical protein
VSSPEISPTGYDKERWMRALEVMATELGKEGTPVRLCLIGSAACLLGNMPDRISRDLGIWKPSSEYDTLQLKSAAEKAGILFNPIGLLEPTQPYLQIVEPGIVQVGNFQPVLMEKMGRLEIYRPPIENIIASKLTRASEKDIEDIHYLSKVFLLDKDLVKKIIETFPQSVQESALENLVYLDIIV